MSEPTYELLPRPARSFDTRALKPTLCRRDFHEVSLEKPATVCRSSRNHVSEAGAITAFKGKRGETRPFTP